jgi:hypothetical protein
MDFLGGRVNRVERLIGIKGEERPRYGNHRISDFRYHFLPSYYSTGYSSVSSQD